MATLTENGDGTVDLTFQQGATEVFHRDIYTDESLTTLADLSGYSARGAGRQAFGEVSMYPILFDIACTVSGGRVTCTITPSESSATNITSGVYDIEIYDPTDSDVVYNVQKGSWTMEQEATV